jgi:uncharacterized membrane protein
MRALGRVPAPAGIAAMQAINITVLNLWFLGTFLGTAALSLLLAVMATIHWQSPASPWLAAAGFLYFFGTLVVTLICNVPRNERLAKADAQANAAVPLWSRYLVAWTAWNTVRTLAALVACALFIVGLGRF